MWWAALAQAVGGTVSSAMSALDKEYYSTLESKWLKEYASQSLLGARKAATGLQSTQTQNILSDLNKRFMTNKLMRLQSDLERGAVTARAAGSGAEVGVGTPAALERSVVSRANYAIQENLKLGKIDSLKALSDLKFEVAMRREKAGWDYKNQMRKAWLIKKQGKVNWFNIALSGGQAGAQGYEQTWDKDW